MTANWTALGLDKLGAQTSVDGAHRPSHSHELPTSVHQPDGKRAQAWDALLVD